MRAIFFEEHGGPDVLQFGERPRPVPKADQVLIAVHAAGVNPRDWMLRQGTYIGGRLAGPLPIIPGSDVSGVVVETGAKVSGFAIGDEVVAMQSALGHFGAYAEFIAVKEGCVAHKPPEISHVDAAALPVAGLTAWQALFDIAKVGSGAAVTVVGAAGGVGHYATQLARWAGAEVTGVCGPDNLAFVHELGARMVVDYREQPFTDVVADQNLVFDTIGATRPAAAARALAPHGFHVTTVPNLQIVADTVLSRLRGGKRVVPVLVSARQADLTSLLQLMAAGDLRSEIAAVFPLAEAGAALAASRTQRTRGKLVLRIVD